MQWGREGIDTREVVRLVTTFAKTLLPNINSWNFMKIVVAHVLHTPFAQDSADITGGAGTPSDRAQTREVWISVRIFQCWKI
jgi:hypothetical protein